MHSEWKCKITSCAGEKEGRKLLACLFHLCHSKWRRSIRSLSDSHLLYTVANRRKVLGYAKSLHWIMELIVGVDCWTIVYWICYFPILNALLFVFQYGCLVIYHEIVQKLRSTGLSTYPPEKRLIRGNIFRNIW